MCGENRNKSGNAITIDSLVLEQLLVLDDTHTTPHSKLRMEKNTFFRIYLNCKNIVLHFTFSAIAVLLFTYCTKKKTIDANKAHAIQIISFVARQPLPLTSA